MNLNIREMLPKERDYAYTQSYQLMSQSGCIALMRGDFGNGGRTFYPDYEDQIKQYRTDEFAAEFDSVIKEFYKVGILWRTLLFPAAFAPYSASTGTSCFFSSGEIRQSDRLLSVDAFKLIIAVSLMERWLVTEN